MAEWGAVAPLSLPETKVSQEHGDVQKVEATELTRVMVVEAEPARTVAVPEMRISAASSSTVRIRIEVGEALDEEDGKSVYLALAPDARRQPALQVDPLKQPSGARRVFAKDNLPAYLADEVKDGEEDDEDASDPNWSPSTHMPTGARRVFAKDNLPAYLADEVKDGEEDDEDASDPNWSPSTHMPTGARRVFAKDNLPLQTRSRTVRRTMRTRLTPTGRRQRTCQPVPVACLRRRTRS